MTHGSVRPFISVKFTPAGRTHSFLLPELALDGPDTPAGDQPIAAAADPSRPADSPKPGDAVVVRTAEGTALATMTRAILRSRSDGVPHRTVAIPSFAGPPTRTSSPA